LLVQGLHPSTLSKGPPVNHHRTPGPTGRSLPRRLAGSFACTVALAVAATACGSSPSSAPEVIAVPTTASPELSAPTAPSSTATGGSTEPAPAEPAALVVRPGGDLELRDAPDASSPARTIAARTELGSPTALLVTDRREGWVQVLVPGRPTGATAWIADAGLTLAGVDLTIHVDLGARTLTLTDGDTEVLTTSVAVGAPATPTPVGRFSVTDKLDTQAPAGPYGRYAIGLSGRSEVLTEFAGGDGQIGIHGTNDPASIGHDVSHGCIRVPNEVMEELNRILPLGTPVVVS
jgi:lipoprotein-anchoring transpeptidase ErfK/SrfK